MIFPQTNSPKDITTSMIRIADSYSNDVKLMSEEIKSLNEVNSNLRSQYNEQQDRWKQYKDAYDAIYTSFYILGGSVESRAMLDSLPWAKLSW